MKNLKKNVNILLFIVNSRPGAIVKKITFKKGIDFCGKIIIIIIVKGQWRKVAFVERIMRARKT